MAEPGVLKFKHWKIRASVPEKVPGKSLLHLAEGRGLRVSASHQLSPAGSWQGLAPWGTCAEGSGGGGELGPLQGPSQPRFPSHSKEVAPRGGCCSHEVPVVDG